MSKTFLTAEWRKLIMAQYAVDPAVLRPYLPGGVELDVYGPEGVSYVSLVGFLFDRVRLKGVPIPWHTRFEEINLRFYVRRVLGDGSVRRGVVFVNEIVPKAAITLTARALYGEAYDTAATSHLWRSSETQMDINYSWMIPKARLALAGRKAAGRKAAGRKPRWQHLSVQAEPVAGAIEAGSLEEFITEHYWGYTLHTGLMPRGGATGEYGVAHPRWETYAVREAQVEADFGVLYGAAFAGLTERTPDHVLLAEGSAIAIRNGGAFTA